MTDKKLGFVGLGRMGGPMSERLINAGYELTVYDPSEAALNAVVAHGGRKAGSPREVADAAPIVLTSLPTPDVVELVALGPDGLAGGAAIEIMLDLSTTGPNTAKRVAEGLSKHAVQWVDCPVSGGVTGAANGTLAEMVSCPQPVYARIEPIIANFGRPFFVGEDPGLAQVVKLGNNMLAAAALVLSSEALAMGVKAGVDPKVMTDIINVSSGRNSATQDKFPKAILPGTFDFGFTTALSYKDVRLCVEEAEAMGVPMLGGALIRQILTITKAKYGPDSDFTCIAKVIEEWAGVEIRG
ncbi:NAD(P)-dependent oxidoreductase [uncultured Nisaea sp.]|uniref:NAD(P)-dependent oxidoreductase n=1 Tax=uncultured Nisaea sp. TaxID=538215 RepID=UPI0030ED1717|tara:strand:- start:1388 stop:2281 length:894 start_codon:yes stop_codon:yes gene_type:complete